MKSVGHVRPGHAAVGGAVDAVAVVAVAGQRTLARAHVDDVVVARAMASAPTDWVSLSLVREIQVPAARRRSTRRPGPRRG